MLDAREIDIEIARLEYGESSYPAYAKLADLYIIRNQMQNSEVHTEYERAYSAAPAGEISSGSLKVGQYGDSDFLQAIADKEGSAVWAVMDDLMDTLRVANPRVYNGVMRKISNL